jgi:hypothetical protein
MHMFTKVKFEMSEPVWATLDIQFHIWTPTYYPILTYFILGWFYIYHEWLPKTCELIRRDLKKIQRKEIFFREKISRNFTS